MTQYEHFLPNDAKPEYSNIKHVTSVGNSVCTQYSLLISRFKGSILNNNNSKLVYFSKQNNTKHNYSSQFS